MEAVRPLEKGLEYKSFSSDKGDEMKRSSSFSLDKCLFNLRLVERFGSEQLSSFQSEAERVMQDGNATARGTDETKNKQQVMFPSRAAGDQGWCFSLSPLLGRSVWTILQPTPPP